MKNRFSRLTALGMLTALVVVLQTAATFIRFGSFPITLRADATGKSEVYWK